MAQVRDETAGLESTTIGIYRTAATVKGGRRFSFGAMVVVGDRNGSVGLGYAKAPGVPAAIEKAQKTARKKLRQLVLHEGTLPHATVGRFGSSSVKLIPASPGTGVIAGGAVRAVLEMAGVRDCLTKANGSTNAKNVAKAVMDGLYRMRSKAQVAALRGVEIETTLVEEKVAAGRRFAPATSEQTSEVMSGQTKSGATSTQVAESGESPEAKEAAREAAEQAAPAPSANDASPQRGGSPQDTPAGGVAVGESSIRDAEAEGQTKPSPQQGGDSPATEGEHQQDPQQPPPPASSEGEEPEQR